MDHENKHASIQLKHAKGFEAGLQYLPRTCELLGVHEDDKFSLETSRLTHSTAA